MIRAKAVGENADLLRLDRQICFPLYAASNLLQRIYRPLLAPLGLTYTQYLVMLVLWERKKVSVGELCECLHLDVGTLSPLLKRMEARDLVMRRRDADDERRVFIEASAHGLTLEASAQKIPLTLAELTDIEESEAEDIRTSSQRLLARLANVAA